MGGKYQRKRPRYTTAEQAAYRAELMKSSACKSTPAAPVHVPPVRMVKLLRAKLPYMDNCLWWVNEYAEGRCKPDRFIYALETLVSECIEIKTIYREENRN